MTKYNFKVTKCNFVTSPDLCNKPGKKNAIVPSARPEGEYPLWTPPKEQNSKYQRAKGIKIKGQMSSRNESRRG